MTVRFKGLAAAAMAASMLCVSLGVAPAGGIEPLAAYAGTWRIHITHYKTRYSKARTETSLLKNDCWRSAGFYACDQIVDGVSRALIVYTYDAKAAVYHSQVLLPGGGLPSSGTLMIAGNTWTFPWQDKDGKRTVYLRVVNIFVNRNTIKYRQEFSFDKIKWVLAASGGERRLR